jgi:hypothetical protein
MPGQLDLSGIDSTGHQVIGGAESTAIGRLVLRSEGLLASSQQNGHTRESK